MRRIVKKVRDKDRDREKTKSTGPVIKRSRCLQGVAEIDFRDVNLLRRFITQQGKIMPSRLTGASAKQQRAIASAIRRSRVMGLMP